MHVQSTIFFKEYLKFYAFKENEHYYSKNLHNFVRSKYVIFQRTYTILHFQRTQFFLIVENSVHLTNTITQDLHNFICSKYAILKILHTQQSVWLKDFT